MSPNHANDSYINSANLRSPHNERSVSMYDVVSWPAYTIDDENKKRIASTSHDSAISMDCTTSECQSLEDQSADGASECCSMTINENETDSGIDMSTSIGQSFENFAASDSSPVLSLPVTIARAQMCNVEISDTAKFNSQSDMEIDNNCLPQSIIFDKNNLLRRDRIFETLKVTRETKWQSLNCSSAPPQVDSVCFKFPTNDKENSVSGLSMPAKKIVTPRRYVRWKRSKSCYYIPKITPNDCNAKLFKNYSHPDLERYTIDPIINDSPPFCRNRNNNSKGANWRLATNFFAKLSEINFPHTFKQYMQVSPPRKSIEKNPPRQKYTPLPSPLPVPAKIAKITRVDGEAFTRENNFCNSKDNKNFEDFPSSSVNLRAQVRAETGKLKRPDDNSFLVVPFFFSLYLQCLCR